VPARGAALADADASDGREDDGGAAAAGSSAVPPLAPVARRQRAGLRLKCRLGSDIRVVAMSEAMTFRALYNRLVDDYGFDIKIRYSALRWSRSPVAILARRLVWNDAHHIVSHCANLPAMLRRVCGARRAVF
jgi:hypothetical protein